MAPRGNPWRCGRPRGGGSAEKCRKTVLNEGDSCRFHGNNGNNLPVVVTKRANAQLDADAAELLGQTLGEVVVLPSQAADVAPARDGTPVRIVANPLVQLQQLAAEVMEWKDALRVTVEELKGRLRFTDERGAEQLRSEVALYERALDRCAAILIAIGRLNVDERLARVTERQAGAIVTATDRALRLAKCPTCETSLGEDEVARLRGHVLQILRQMTGK